MGSNWVHNGGAAEVQRIGSWQVCICFLIKFLPNSAKPDLNIKCWILSKWWPPQKDWLMLAKLHALIKWRSCAGNRKDGYNCRVPHKQPYISKQKSPPPRLCIGLTGAWVQGWSSWQQRLMLRKYRQPSAGALALWRKPHIPAGLWPIFHPVKSNDCVIIMTTFSGYTLHNHGENSQAMCPEMRTC